ncbi:metabotropic glutamate receptor 3 isoform X1 [Biomphalaria glabrata]|nr:metabotropic glutamate receptor 3 isoform X1 [Biomphalaria glabrata]
MKAKKGKGPSLQSGEIKLKHQGMHRPYSFHLGVFLVFVGVASLASTSFATNSFHMTSTPSDNFNSYKFQENFFKNSDHLFEMVKEDGDSGRSGRHNTRRHHRNPTTNINALTKARKPESDLFAEGMDDLLVESDSTVRLAPKHNLNYTWPIRELASLVDGDITIGALHMIHERSEEYGCGRIMDQGGIQALEVMLYTLDHINGKYGQPLIPGVHLGVLAKDDCDTDIYGLEQALDFIRGPSGAFVSNYLPPGVSVLGDSQTVPTSCLSAWHLLPKSRRHVFWAFQSSLSFM